MPWPTSAVSTLMIHDRVAECSDGNVETIEHIEALVMHRISLVGLGIPDEQLDGPRMCAAFQDPEKLGGYTGDENPYPLLVRFPEGVIEQLMPLREVGKHAAAWNSKAIAIAVVGDFRKHHPDPRQWNRALLLAAVLSQALDLRILGHDELGAGGSKDPAKRCPGRFWPMPAFRAQVAETVSNNRGDLGSQGSALSLLARAGATLGG